jgi:uncharacterized protein (DUF3084 family)
MTMHKASKVDSETQTYTELLEHITSLEAQLKKACSDVDILEKETEELVEEASKYRNLWMTECQYSANLVQAGAELNGGVSQAPDWAGSSPYHHCTSVVLSSCYIQTSSEDANYLAFGGSSPLI